MFPILPAHRPFAWARRRPLAVAARGLAQAIHFPKLILLFALMIVSVRCAAAGFYDWAAMRIAAAAGSPTRLLLRTIAVGGGLSAVSATCLP